jgi:hypothetical protein
VASVAPEEAEMFPALADVYVADPDRALSRDRARDESLGFGVGGVEALLIPVIVHVVGAVLERVGDAVGQSVADSVKQLLSRLFRGRPKQGDESGSDTSVRSSQEQARAIWRVALEKAREAGVDDKTARIIANATVVELLLGPDRPPSAS